jgi:voltage-gated potassium channel
MTKVGYGDTYPMTVEGRVVAVFLMTSAVGVFGMLSGLVASWFLSPAAEETDQDVEELKVMVKDLRDELQRHRAQGNPVELA